MRAAGIKKRVGKNQYIGQLFFNRWLVGGQAQLLCQISATKLAFLNANLNLAVHHDTKALIASYAKPQGGLNVSKRRDVESRLTSRMLKMDWQNLAEQKSTLEHLKGKLRIYGNTSKNSPASHLQNILYLIVAIQSVVVDTKLIPRHVVHPPRVSYLGHDIVFSFKTAETKSS